MRRKSAMSKSAGFTLVELMISVVLGLLLIAGAVATYLSSKRSYTEVEQFSALTENARFAELMMTDALLHAGFFGEVTSERLEARTDLTAPTGDCSGEAAAYNFSQYIFGATVAADGSAIGCIDDGREGTDVLVVKRAIPRPLSDGARWNGVRNGTIDTPTTLQADTTYIMTNDVLGLIFDGADTAPDIQAGGDVPNGVAWPYLFEAYYVRDVPAPVPGDPPTPVLARKTLVWDTTALSMTIDTENLVEGVEQMRLQMGYDSDGDREVDAYTDVAGMTGLDWTDVGSVEVYLLVRSTTPDPQFTESKTYHLGGDNFVTPDTDLNYRRLLVSTQASLRNPKLVLRR
ncbi:MAG: PilW family protein [Halioglobus sp.]